MDTKHSTAAEARFQLEEKYRRWKETHLPAGDLPSTYLLDQQIRRGMYQGKAAGAT